MNRLIEKEILPVEPNWLPVCDDIKEYFSFLRGTSEYQKIIKQKFADQKVIPGEAPLSKREIRNFFEQQEQFKAFFWDFDSRVIHLCYQPENYTKNFRQAFKNYQQKVLASLYSISSGNPDLVRKRDQIRSQAHDQAAKVLVEERIVPTKFLGRILVRAFLVDQKGDVIKSARQADMLRVLRNVADNPKAIAQTKKKFSQFIGKEFFTSKRIEEIQQNFLIKHPNAPKVRNADFTLARNSKIRQLIEP